VGAVVEMMNREREHAWFAPARWLRTVEERGSPTAQVERRARRLCAGRGRRLSENQRPQSWPRGRGARVRSIRTDETGRCRSYPPTRWAGEQAGVGGPILDGLCGSSTTTGARSPPDTNVRSRAIRRR